MLLCTFAEFILVTENRLGQKTHPQTENSSDMNLVKCPISD